MQSPAAEGVGAAPCPLSWVGWWAHPWEALHSQDEVCLGFSEFSVEMHRNCLGARPVTPEAGGELPQLEAEAAA